MSDARTAAIAWHGLPARGFLGLGLEARAAISKLSRYGNICQRPTGSKALRKCSMVGAF